MIHYNAKFLRNLELEITMAYSFDKDYPQCKRLIELRRDILNEQALANQAELLPDIIAFNDAICLALRRMFDHAHEIYSRISVFQPSIELEARCFLPKIYPALHLINAFHNLFDHTYFALTDFIFCREFVEEINVKIEESHSY